jgi:hypothetical protein
MSGVVIPECLAKRTRETLRDLVKLQFQMQPDRAEMATAIAKAIACAVFLESCIESQRLSVPSSGKVTA